MSYELLLWVYKEFFPFKYGNRLNCKTLSLVLPTGIKYEPPKTDDDGEEGKEKKEEMEEIPLLINLQYVCAQGQRRK
jgi:hypothetical protein